MADRKLSRFKGCPCDTCGHTAHCAATGVFCTAFAAFIGREPWHGEDRTPSVKVTIASRRAAARVSLIEQREDLERERRQKHRAQIAAWRQQHPDRVALYRQRKRERRAAVAAPPPARAVGLQPERDGQHSAVAEHREAAAQLGE